MDNVTEMKWDKNVFKQFVGTETYVEFRKFYELLAKGDDVRDVDFSTAVKIIFGDMEKLAR